MAFGEPVGVVVDVVEGGDAAAVVAFCGGEDTFGVTVGFTRPGLGTAAAAGGGFGGSFGGMVGTGFFFRANGVRDRASRGVDNTSCKVVDDEAGEPALAAVSAGGTFG